ncbi:amidohydrolase family protein [Streptomyces sp. NPDC017673]|uniref:amidohydrolase family protein n=1 Tax=unclassified Streptomyces TaxID=2593676 RepID=UPI0037BDCA25
MPRNRIDVHTHAFGPTLTELFDSQVIRLRGGYKISARWTPESALAFMDRNDIAAQVLSVPFAFSGTPDDPDFGIRTSRRVNEDHAEIVSARPDRFGAFACLPGDSAQAALAELEYALDELALDGVILPSNVNGRYFGDEFFEPLLEELNRRRVPVFVHPTEHLAIDSLGFDRPSSVIEYPLDTARNITNAVYTGVFQRYPDLRLILAHCGGALPTLGWRIAEHTEMGRGPKDADIDPAHVTQVLRGLYYETALAGAAHSLLPTLQVTGADHVLFGTDWPAAPETTVTHNTANLLSFGFTEDELVDIERRNAARLFPRLG